MEMKGIADFLEGYKEKLRSAEQRKEEIKEAIYRSSGIRIVESQFAIKKGTIIVKGGSVLRNEIFLKKASILKELKHVKGMHISDIS